jgi:hypothetical protein
MVGLALLILSYQYKSDVILKLKDQKIFFTGIKQQQLAAVFLGPICSCMSVMFVCLFVCLFVCSFVQTRPKEDYVSLLYNTQLLSHIAKTLYRNVIL